ncbi:hypothetical protein ILYODFUR_024776, partial [Ilyodon furcidens]
RHLLQNNDEICVEFVKEYTVDSYRWETSFQSLSWLSPSRLHPPELGSRYNLSDDQQNIRRGGSTRSLQLDSRMMSCNGDRGHELGQENRRRTFQWERNQSGEWERRQTVQREEKRRHEGEGKQMELRSRDVAVHHREHLQLHGRDSVEDTSSPIYEEYREDSHDPEPDDDSYSLYDTLPPTRRAYEGYPSSPPGLNLHPAQLMPPLRAWDLQEEQWRGSQEDQEGLGSASLTGSGDELERLLNLVSLRARRATRTNRTSTGSEAKTSWDGCK